MIVIVRFNKRQQRVRSIEKRVLVPGHVAFLDEEEKPYGSSMGRRNLPLQFPTIPSRPIFLPPHTEHGITSIKSDQRVEEADIIHTIYFTHLTFRISTKEEKKRERERERETSDMLGPVPLPSLISLEIEKFEKSSLKIVRSREALYISAICLPYLPMTVARGEIVRVFINL